ncbi:MAG: hypothetical protein ACR2MA_08595 [Egibacteraceae bacterium]
MRRSGPALGAAAWCVGLGVFVAVQDETVFGLAVAVIEGVAVAVLAMAGLPRCSSARSPCGRR